MNFQFEETPHGGCFGLFGKQPKKSILSQFQKERPIKLERKESGSESSPSPDEVISLIAQDMTRMSLQEREKAENDVHGICDGDIETPEILDRCVAELGGYLEENKRGTAFELAEALDRSYTSNFDLRAMFVRAERYHSAEAAQRMIRFFECKRDLFGVGRLTKDITLDDLDVDDMEALESGGLQLCPAKDSAGRNIITIMLGLRKFKEAENMQRACFYIYMVVAQDQDAQRRGIVVVSYSVGVKVFKSVQNKLRISIPLHIASQHFAHDDPVAYVSASKPIFLLTKFSRVRFRSHMGTHVECQYALTTFGIPRHALPVDTNGYLSRDFHLAWLQKRRELEESQPIPYLPQTSPAFPGVSSAHVTSGPLFPSSGAITPPDGTSLQVRDPRLSDILFGRGKTVVEHPGNAWFRDLVDRTMLKYEACSRMEKANIAEMIVNMVKDAGGRFLKSEDEGDFWEEVDDHTARKKVAHTFRNRRKFHVGIMRVNSPMQTSSNSAGSS